MRYILLFWALWALPTISFSSEDLCVVEGHSLECSVSVLMPHISDVGSLEISFHLRDAAWKFQKALSGVQKFQFPLWSTAFYKDDNGPNTALFIKHDAQLLFQNGAIKQLRFTVQDVESDLSHDLNSRISEFLQHDHQFLEDAREKLSQQLVSSINIASEQHIRSPKNRMDITAPMRKMGLTDQINKKLPGNQSESFLHKAELGLLDPDLIVDLHFQIDAKDSWCVDKPWPFEGEWCFYPWRVNTHVGLEAQIDPECAVTAVDLTLWGTHTKGLAKIVEPFLKLAYVLFEDMAERHVQKAMQAAIKRSPEMSDMCQ